ncbi:four helix bundle protein [Heyndrickxia oleronia]|jgi:four helix bundle protein|uniref:four helix bundle protein n=1 Tax=Heyndrickxia oleronia TaxID=38875 RepID=UPI00242B58B2|nr:four helix bundle protein [Heyndrickxia oleronia]MCI1592649.1 four helix bundle protein [Heyndrickxia oleronia]MCI1614416.1 four helix bundle protein [Heyndrickxia oleronia]MCI1745473.1 four helix bundle protein [Heyndrickxia oleronia]MCI1763796.1 four helix bundle protein [Heyndrickxia oleronia]
MAEKKTFVGNFRDLEVYKKSLHFSKKIYKVVERFPSFERNNLVDQLRRASSSVYSNIAEGNANYYYRKEYDRLNTSIGSIAECQAFLDMAIMQKYVSREVYVSLDNEAEEIFKMLIAMINRIEKILKEEAS